MEFDSVSRWAMMKKRENMHDGSALKEADLKEIWLQYSLGHVSVELSQGSGIYRLLFFLNIAFA